MALPPNRTFRVSPEEWEAARQVSEERGEVLAEVLRACLRRYVRRHQKAQQLDHGVSEGEV